MSFLNKAKAAAEATAERAKSYAAEHKDTITDTIDKAGRLADRKTGGKYHDKIERAGQGATSYVDALTDAPEPTPPTPPTPRTPG